MTRKEIADPTGSDDSADGRDDASRVRDVLTRKVFDQSRTALVFAALCVLLCATILYATVDTRALLLWSACGLATVLLRVPLVADAGNLPDDRLPYRRKLALVAASGIVWGSAALFWSSDLDVSRQLVIVLFPITMSISAILSYGARRSLYFAFALPAQLPQAIVFLLSPGVEHLALPAVLCLAAEVSMVARYNAGLRETVTLRIAQQTLAEDLAARNAALAAARDEAQSANAAKSEFLARMSHEIRTPMNGVLGVAALLSKTGLDADQHRLLDTLEASAGTLLGLLDELLDISHVENGHLSLEERDYALRAELDGMLEPERGEADRRGLAFDCTVDESVPEQVHGDPFRLGQIVRNLVENAVRFTERGGVRVEVTRATSGEGEPRLVLSVSDTGIGIAASELEHVFELFRQADGSSTRRIGGSGLGLALVREIVTLMGGTVRATSEPGQGSTFVVDVPLVEVGQGGGREDGQGGGQAARPDGATAADDRIRAPRPADGGVARPPSVLVAEDNPVNQMVIEAMLEEFGCLVRIAEDGAAALDALEEGGFDMVFMDCQMPVVDGFDATRQARDRGHRLPIVAVTANAMAGDRERCLAAGMDDYLSKPVTSEALGAMLERWGGVAIEESAAA